MLKLAAEAKDSVPGSSLPKGTVTIGAPESLSIFRLPPLLQNYRQRFPQVKIILKLGSCRDIHDWLSKNLIDLAFVLDNPIDRPELVSRLLVYEPMTLIAASNHVLGNKPFSNPGDLSGENLIQVEEEGCCYRSIFEAQLADAGVKPGSIMEFGSVETIKKCVGSGLGISLLPYVAVEQEIHQGQLADLHWNGPDFNIYTQLLYYKDKWLSPALVAMIQLAEEIIKGS